MKHEKFSMSITSCIRKSREDFRAVCKAISGSRSQPCRNTTARAATKTKLFTMTNFANWVRSRFAAEIERFNYTFQVH